ncbi:GntR family transcriptional regulator [Cohaesibacter celericrescens]|uniref:GntR family transcriptional regulator n=1 Tax=Cohaesibacter celericrescens TaxID=2067669 RepID=A0A2N5XLR2_9HYPH|nr:GntR family transcriptional regulator [Cohaesibacter celericrescens]PLW75370.1 GntR family transcriptional regulator [Cohaesibacter celericrescens]
MSNKPAKPKSLTDQAYEVIREAILTNELKPETLWTDRELSEKFGLSRTPVREAVLRLKTQKLVEILPRRGTRILPLSVDDIREIQQLSKALELEAARSISLQDDRTERAKDIGRAVEAMEQAIETEDRQSWVKADMQFHRAIMFACNNNRLCDMYLSMRELTDRARFFTMHVRELPRKSTVEHRQIYEAICTGDSIRLAELYHAHWARTTKELLSIIEQQDNASMFRNSG